MIAGEASLPSRERGLKRVNDELDKDRIASLPSRVNKSEGKFATAHDLRRSFGTRWASRVKPATLQLLMRHRSIETTMKYYVCQNADDIADELWSEYGNAPSDKAS